MRMHGVSNDRLIAIAGKLTNVLRIGEPVFRMGGDEFAITFPISIPAQVTTTLACLINADQSLFQFGVISVKINVSVGIKVSGSIAHA